MLLYNSAIGYDRNFADGFARDGLQGSHESLKVVEFFL